MLWHAATWRDGDAARDSWPDLTAPARYVDGFGRRGDAGVVAERAGRGVGAAWYRLLPADDPGYGFVDGAVPEVSLGVEPGMRGQGVGTALMRRLLDRAAADHVPALSLSVERDNGALRLYERLGFVSVGASGGSLTLLRTLLAGRTGLDTFLAEWVLGRLAPEEAVRRAVRALEEGCDHPSVAVVAGSKATTRGEIDSELRPLLAAFDRGLPTPDEALKALVDDCAARIVERQVDPVMGAREMFDLWVNEHESPELLGQIRPFVDPAFDDDLSTEGPASRRDALLAEALAFVVRGGLRLPI